MKVMKFGGTSVGTAARMQAVAQLVMGAGRNVVVLSAMSGTTNALAEIAGYLYNRNTDGARDVIGRLETKYLKTVQELYASADSRKAAEAFIHQTFEQFGGMLPQGEPPQGGAPGGFPGDSEAAPPEPIPQLPFRREAEKIGRNDPCPCGSGKKYKKCCGRNEA